MTIEPRKVTHDELAARVARAAGRARTGGKLPLDELLDLANDAKRHADPEVRAIGQALLDACWPKTTAVAAKLTLVNTDQEDKR